MAEVLGVAASVAGLMTIADSIVRKGFNFIKDVKEAEESVEKLVEEVNNLSGVLHSLNNVVERLEEDERTVDPSTRIHYIESCYKTLKKINDHFDEALPASLLSRGQKLKWPLKKAYTKELLDEIGRHKATMILAMGAREMATLLEILAGQDNILGGLQGIKLGLEADRAERQKFVINEERQKMLRTLGDVDARKWQDSNIRLRQPGTGVWFTDGAEFKSWLSEDKSKLWINGIPGAGKTILISTVIQEIEKSIESSHALAYFYCDYKDPQTQDPLNILGSLAKQLILQDERCFTQLSEFYHHHTTNDGSTRSHTPEKLCKLIRKISTHFQTTMIVVDGLDEITYNRAEVTRNLSSLNTEGGKIKTLFAGRPEVDLGYELEDFVQVSIAAMSSDLRLYVASEIERRTRDKRLRIQESSLKDHIMTTLVEGADGMFRWVSCQMDYLCECNNDRDRREALEKLPPDLPSSYERILERVNRSSKENQALVMKTLHWIVYADDAAYRDLTTDMLLQALAIRDGDDFFDQNSMTTEEEVLYWCSSLVRKDIWSTSLELSHFTVKEFLQTIDPVRKPHLRQYCLSGDHTILAKACLNFIQCPQFAELPNLMPDCKGRTGDRRRCSCMYEFISYACNSWSYHVHNSSWDVIQEDVDSILCTETALRCWTMHWLHYQQPKDYSFHIRELFQHPHTPSPLHWAALFGFDKLCATYLQSGMDASQQSCVGTPLYCAMLSRYAMKSFDKLEDDMGQMAHMERIQSSRSWQPQARQSVIRQLLEAQLDLDKPVDPQGQHRALTIALKLEFWCAYPYTFISSTLVAAGARFSKKNFSILRKYVKTWIEFYLLDGVSERFDICGVRISLLMEAITRESWKALVLGAEFEFFSFALEIVSCNWRLQSFQSFLHVRFKDLFPESNGSELDKLLCDESEDWGSRLVHVLSKAIVNSAATPDRATSRLQRALFYASATSNASVVSLLWAFNPDLDASRRDMRSKDTYLHPPPQPTLESAEVLELIDPSVSRSANVLLPDKSGISPIEYAAYGCSLHIFELYWDFGGRSGTFADPIESLPNDLQLETVAKVLVAAIESKNRPVMEFVMREWFGEWFRSKTGDKALLRFAIEQETSTLLRTVIDDQKDCYSSSERASDDENEDEENQGYSGDVDDRGGVVLAGGNRRQRRRKRNRDTASTPLELQAFHLAATSDGSANNFTFLLERGLPTSHQDQDGNTVLHLLAAQSYESSIPKLQALLNTPQPKLDIRNKNFLTPLALATQTQNIQIMELLLDAGADPEITLVEEQTALHIACDLGNQGAVEVLLKHGCQTSQMNSQGQTPKDIALAKGHHEIAAAIQNKIDSTITSRETQPSSSSSIEHHTDAAPLNLSQTENHGELPLRVVQADTTPNEALDDVLDAPNFSTATNIDTMATPSQPTANPIS